MYATARQTCPRPRPRGQNAFKNSTIHGILQFTLGIAFRYVLHRNESRDIRCRESLHHVLHPLANQCDPCNKCPGPWRTRHHCQHERHHSPTAHPCQGQDSREPPRLKSTQLHRGSPIARRAPRGCPQRRNERESKASTPKTLPPQSSHMQGGLAPQGKWQSTVGRRTRVASPAGCTAFHPPSDRCTSSAETGSAPPRKWQSTIERRTRVASPAGCAAFHPPSDHCVAFAEHRRIGRPTLD